MSNNCPFWIICKEKFNDNKEDCEYPKQLCLVYQELKEKEDKEQKELFVSYQ